jgi:hypothetical protein
VNKFFAGFAGRGSSGGDSQQADAPEPEAASRPETAD